MGAHLLLLAPTELLASVAKQGPAISPSLRILKSARCAAGDSWHAVRHACDLKQYIFNFANVPIWSAL